MVLNGSVTTALSHYISCIFFMTFRPIREMLGGEDGVTNKNMMIYLGQIEQRTTELLNMLQFSKMKVRHLYV